MCLCLLYIHVWGQKTLRERITKKHKNLPFVSGPVVSMINDRAVLLLFLHHAWLCYFCFSQDSNGLWYVAIENINYSTELSNHDGQVSVYWMYATQWPKDTEWKKRKVIIWRRRENEGCLSLQRETYSDMASYSG